MDLFNSLFNLHIYYKLLVMGQITDTELQRINLIKKDSIDVASSLGELQYQKISLEILMEEQKQKVKELKAEEAKLLSELKDNYGNININLETGEYTQI